MRIFLTLLRVPNHNSTTLVILYLRLLNIKLSDSFETNLFRSLHLIVMIIKTFFNKTQNIFILLKFKVIH